MSEDSVIRSREYDETEARLARDPIVRAMAEEIAALSDEALAGLAHDSGTPTFDFMLSANREYRARGGQDGGHIGAVARALLMVVKDGRDG